MRAAERARTDANLDPSSFSSVLHGIMQVSKTDLNIMLAAEKARNAHKPKRGPKPKSSASSPAADDTEMSGTG
jgi:hypothetical protein